MSDDALNVPTPAAPAVSDEAAAAGPSRVGDDPIDHAPMSSPVDAASVVAGPRSDYLETLQRLQTDFENFRKRTLRDRSGDAGSAQGEVVARLLPVLDAFDAALEHHRDVVDPLDRALRSSLEPLGLERIDPAGEPFDPSSQDAVVHHPGDAAKPEVFEVLRPGYRFAGRLLRPAAVAVRG